MLRRTLPVLAAAAVAALGPGTASAAPGQTPESSTFDSIDAGIQLTVAGQPGRASLSLRGEPGDRTASLDVTLPPEPCALPFCYRSLRTGSAELSDEQIRVGRDLKVASAVDVPITLYSAGWDAENGTTEIEEPLTVSLTITATGRLSHDVEHGDICGEGWPCHGTHVTAWREGAGVLTTADGWKASGVGLLWRGHSVSAAVVRSGGQEGPGDAPSDGSGELPSNGSGDAPSDGSGELPSDGSGDGTWEMPAPWTAPATESPAAPGN